MLFQIFEIIITYFLVIITESVLTYSLMRKYFALAVFWQLPERYRF